MAEEQNECSNQKCPVEVLFTSDTTGLCHWLSMFMKEVRHDVRQPHTPRSLTQLLPGIQCFTSSKIYTTERFSNRGINFKDVYRIYADSGAVYAIYSHLFFLSSTKGITYHNIMHAKR